MNSGWLSARRTRSAQNARRTPGVLGELGALSGACLLLFVFGINTYRYGSVVDEAHLHVGAEFSCLHRPAEVGRELTAEGVVERYGDFVAACTQVAWTVAFLVGSPQGELTHHQYVASAVEDGAVHHTCLVVEDAQVYYLLAQPRNVVVCVGILTAEQHKQSCSYLRLHGSVDSDRCLAHTL